MPIDPVSQLPRVSVIIVSWNARELLKEFLPGVVATDYADLEVILADNASEDGSAEWVQGNLPQVRIVRHEENYAFCKGNNLAYPYASGEYIVFLNNDVEVPPGWLTPLVNRMLSDPSIGAVQPKVRSLRDRSRFEYAGAAGGFLDRFGYPFARGRIFFHTERDSGQYDTPSDIFWATGAAMMLRRSAAEKVGLFDENFFMHMEEIDLCWRLHRAGFRVVLEPGSVVYHVGAASLAESSPRKAYLNFRNSLLTLYKNLSPREWRLTIVLRFGLDALAALRALLAGRPREASAIARAWRDALKMRRVYAGERPDSGSLRMLYNGSIVVDYFVCRRRRFSTLSASRLPLLGTGGRATSGSSQS